MNFSVERLRVWLLAGAGLLVVVVAAFLGYAHYRAHRFLSGLPGRLGIDIRQETDSVTYSQSVKGKTIYTIHAAKAVQRKDGKVTLNDVGIVLYGRGDGSSDRVDRIYGSQFEYDQTAEVIRAMGEVHIDLQAPAPAPGARADYAAGRDAAGHGGSGEAGAGEAKDDRLIHVKTSGLVFLKKLGVAATDQDLEFEFNGMTGHAHGADYNSDTGVLVLQSAVRVNGLEQGRPMVLTAGRAELDRQKNLVTLAHAEYVAVGGAAGTRVAKGERVVVHLRHDGTLVGMEADGGVSLAEGGGGGAMTAARGVARFGEKNEPQSASVSGGVRYTVDEARRQVRGESAEARAEYDAGGRLKRVVLEGGLNGAGEGKAGSGGVHLHERDQVGTVWGERDLTAHTVELGLVTGADGRVQLREARAANEARLVVVNPPGAGKKGGETTSDVSGDVLTAEFEMQGGATRVKSVHGVGRTAVRRVSGTGAVQTSSGETLEVAFRTAGMGAGVSRAGKSAGGGGWRSGDGPGGGGLGGGGLGGEEIATAVQAGHVVMTNVSAVQAKSSTVAGKAGGSAGSLEQRATADRAAYDGASDRMTLSGKVQVADAGNVVWADRVVMEQATGDAVAEGAVKGSYQQAGSAGEMVHVVAERAELKHDSGKAIFYGAGGNGAGGNGAGGNGAGGNGAGGKLARLWQGGSQVEAPVLQFEQRERRIVARGDSASTGMVVRAVFVNAAGSSLGAAGGAKAGVKKAVPVRVMSREMTYSDVARRADFTGGVLVADGDGTMRAQQAVVYLQASGTVKAGEATKEADGSLPGEAKPHAGESHAGLSSGGLSNGGAEVKKDSADGKKVGGAGSFLGGSVERVVASGRVEIVQPGRHASGEQVVYTAADGMFVMTGLPGMPPRMLDDARGSVSGTTLRFHAGDNSVVVLNGPEGSAGQRIRTEMRVNQ